MLTLLIPTSNSLVEHSIILIDTLMKTELVGSHSIIYLNKCNVYPKLKLNDSHNSQAEV